MGLPITWESLRAIAGTAAIARPHIARALVEAGHVATEDEAFDRYLGVERPAYVERYRLPPTQAIQAIHGANGVAVLAHPARSQAQPLVTHLAQAGLDGLEAFYAGHSPQERADLCQLAEQYGLLVTGGSDFHGYSNRVRLGSGPNSQAMIEALRARRRGTQ